MANTETPDRGNSRVEKWTWDSRSRSILDSSMDAAITMDLAGRILDWNHPAEKQFGWSRDEVVGRPLVEFVVPDDLRPQFVAGLKHYRQTGKGRIVGHRVELEALRKNGSTFPVELSATDIDVDGEIVFHAFVRDISDWKRNDERLAREKLEAKLLQQAATLSLGEMTFNEALQNCLSTVCEITFWPVGHVLIPDRATRRLVSTGTWYLADEQEYGALRTANINRSFASGEGLPGKIWKTREPVWIESILDNPDFIRKEIASEFGVRGAFGFPVVCNKQVVAVLEFFHRDVIRADSSLLILVRSIGRELGRIVERRAALEQQSQIAAIVESSNDAIISKSIEGMILSWNRGAEKIYGFSSEEATGQSIRMIIPESLVAEEADMRETLRRGKRLEQFETRRRRKDGVMIDVALSISPIWDSEGNVVGFSTIERDITSQKHRERELTEAKELAEAANRTKGEFLTNISHELRTPMNAIIGMLELALGEDLSEVMCDYLQTASDSARTLLNLLNDLLDFSRMEAGRFEMEPAPFFLRSLLDKTTKMLALRANEKGLELACHVHSNVSDHLLGDSKRLQQILVNLIGNGIKFTEQGEVIIDVELRSRVGDSAILQFSVIDTGIGISRKHQEQIFAPFTQVDATTTRKYTGTGLGLAICRELVDRMGGELWIESKIRKGSRFSFTINAEILKDAPEDGKPPEAVSELRNMPVLVVDDNETNQRILDEMLTSWEMKPTVVDNGEAALEAMENAAKSGVESFPLILVDALMPKVDGFTLIEKARNKRVLKGSTVLMLSSADRQLFQERCDQLDVSAYLEKPVSQSDLFDAVITALHNPEMVRRSSATFGECDRPLNVLLVEDTPANQKVVRAILGKRGHSVSIAGNGRDGIDLLQQEPFNIVLMDIQMPTMDGFQATEAIRRFDNEAKATIPIVAMTAHAMQGDRERCLDAGMDAYLSKPIDAEELVEVVERLAVRPIANPKPTPPVRAQPPAGNETGRDESRIDRAGALKRFGNDEDLLQDMIVYFIEDSAELLNAIQSGLDNAELAEVQRAAHSLKGLAANLGATRTVELAATLERAAEQGAPDDQVRKLFPQLETEVGALVAELRSP